MAAAEKLNVTVPADLARMVREKVKTGAYASDSEVVGKALRLLREREAALADLRASLHAAIDDPTRLTEDEVRAELARRREARRKVESGG